MNHSRIRPATLRNRIMYVLAIHGVQQDNAQSIWDTLVTGNDPRPGHLPPSFTFHGVTVHWPSGVGRRIITPQERKVLNAAIRRTGNGSNPDNMLDSEDTANEARRVYEVLWNNQQQAMAALVKEASEPTEGEQLLHAIFSAVEDNNLAAIQGENVLCGSKKPGGRLLCLEDNHHPGLHHNGKHAWTDTEVVIEHHAPKTKSVKATVTKAKTEPVNDLDKLMDELEALNTTNNAALEL
jgi:hypothetical protein